MSGDHVDQVEPDEADTMRDWIMEQHDSEAPVGEMTDAEVLNYVDEAYGGVDAWRADA